MHQVVTYKNILLDKFSETSEWLQSINTKFRQLQRQFFGRKYKKLVLSATETEISMRVYMWVKMCTIWRSRKLIFKNNMIPKWKMKNNI